MANGIGGILGGMLRRGDKPPKVAPTKTVGVPGYAVYGGFVQTKETNRKVIGSEKWRTYSDIVTNTSIVAAGVRHFLQLIARSEWSVDPAKDIDGEDSSDAAKEAAEFVESVMHDMRTPWSKAMRRAAGYRFWGFGLQEWTAKRRQDDGRFGFLDLMPRPQHTIERWDVSETGDVLAMVQRSPQTAREITISRSKVLYLVDDALTDSPDGLGLFRHMVEPAQRLREYLRIEGIGFQRDLRGIPVGRAPLAALEEAVQNNKITKEQKDSLVAGLEDIVKMQAKSADTGIVLDSQTFEGSTDNGIQVTNVPQWAIELITGNSNGLEQVGGAVERLNREMARILDVEHLLLGETSGSRALGETKMQSLFLQVEGTLADIAEGAEKDLLGPLWRLNGFPDELKPTLRYEAVQFRDVEKIAKTLRDMSVAGAVLAPDDPAVDDVRDLLGVSRAPDPMMIDEGTDDLGRDPGNPDDPDDPGTDEGA